MRSVTVRIWDLPTRLFHWGLLVCIAGLFVTAYVPGMSIEWHARFGYGVLALLAFRILWGFVGGHWSRFASFMPTPRHLLAYLRGRADPAHVAGHSPLAGLSVLAMLLVLAAQVGTGLVGDDEIAFTGPLNRFVATSTGLAATAWHKGIGQWLLVGLIVLHLAAIAFYALVKRNNLVPPMVHGDKALAQPVAASRDDLRVRLLGLALLAACAGGVYLLVRTGA